MTRRHALAFALAALLAVAAAALLWWRFVPRGPLPLESGWAAGVRTIAGTNDETARDGPAWVATFSEPFGIAAAGGIVFVSDAGEAHRIRRVDLAGTVTTIAGGSPGFADGTGADAKFDTPSALVIDTTGNLYVADTANHAVRRIAPDGTVSTLAGDGIPGDSDGRPARFNGPVGIAVDPGGRVIVADTYNDRIRAIAADGTVSTIAGGSSPGAEDGAAADARFDTPCGVAIDPSGAIFVADAGNGAIRKIDPNGYVTTIAQDADGLPIRPVAVAAGPGGTVYAADERGRIIEVDASGRSRTIAGSSQGFADGSGAGARFRRPSGVAVAAEGRLLIADAGNRAVREVTAVSRATVQVPGSPLLHPRFDEDAFARTPLLWPVTPMEGPHEVAGTIGEARGGVNAERFHAGLDVRVDEGTIVRAVRAGSIASPLSTGEFGTLNESVRIGPLAYVHVRAGRDRQGAMLVPGFVPSYAPDGKLMKVRVRRGTRYAAGDVIATVNGFNHVHLNVGWPGEEINPLEFRLANFADSVRPTIAAGGIRFYDEDWQEFHRRGRNPVTVSGRVRIVVDAWDQMDGNRPNRRLGLYALGYEVLTPKGEPIAADAGALPRLRFDRLAAQPDAARIVYAPGSGIPFYRGGRTRFLYVVTNSFRNGVASEGFWDTTALPAGRYTLRVHARDIRGNEAANGDVAVIVQN